MKTDPKYSFLKVTAPVKPLSGGPAVAFLERTTHAAIESKSGIMKRERTPNESTDFVTIR